LFVIAAVLPSAAQTTAPQAAAETRAAKASRLMQGRLYADAATELEAAVHENANDDPARFQYATCLFALGRNAEAREQLDALQAKLGNSPGVDYYLGRLDLLANDFASALRRLERLRASSDYPQAAFYLGLAHLGAGSTAEGIRWLEKAAAGYGAHDPQVHYRLARAYSQAGRDADAEKEYALYRDARAQSRSTEAGVRACSEALHSRPIAEARAVCARIADANDPERLVVLGQLYGEAGAFAEALNPLRAAAKLDPNSFEAWHNIGLSLFRMKRYADARAPLERAAALNPRYFDTLNLLAATLYMLGDDAAALPVLERAHTLNPGDQQIAAALEQLRAAQKKR
jgi:tetratricopeptide (TPR) repeat protein